MGYQYYQCLASICPVLVLKIILKYWAAEHKIWFSILKCRQMDKNIQLWAISVSWDSEQGKVLLLTICGVYCKFTYPKNNTAGSYEHKACVYKQDVSLYHKLWAYVCIWCTVFLNWNTFIFIQGSYLHWQSIQKFYSSKILAENTA